MREYALVLLVTAAVTFLLVPLVRRVAVATHAMHEPRARDVHTEPTPLLGGLAMYGGLIAGLLVASRLAFLESPFQAAGSRTQNGLLLAGALIVVVGFIDDRWGLGAVSKLAGQVAAAGILVWSGQSLPWLPTPNGHIFSLEPDLSVTLTILLVVITINAINFIDGLDGLAAGIVAVAALAFLAYSYWLVKELGNPSQSLPAVSSALLAGMCLGFLPHNFYPARIFMGDTGAMLLGLMLAYGPISSTASLDPALLIDYQSTHVVNRFGTILPLLVPAAVFLIPWSDLVLAVIRRVIRGTPLMTADKEHLHHRLLGIGHSYRQSVLILWLWAAFFCTMVVALSLIRTRLIVLAAVTVLGLLTLLPVTMPSLRPWRLIAKTRSSQPAAPGAGAAGAGAAGPIAASAVGPIPGPPVPPRPNYAPLAGVRQPSGGNGQSAHGDDRMPAGDDRMHDGRMRDRDGRAPRAAHRPSAANGTPPATATAPVTGIRPVPGIPAANDAAPANGIIQHGPAVPGPGPSERMLRPFPADAELGFGPAQTDDPPAAPPR